MTLATAGGHFVASGRRERHKNCPGSVFPEFIQFRRAGGVWQQTSFPATGATIVHKNTRFDAADGCAIHSGWSIPNAAAIDLLAVDANGDWGLEHSVSISPLANEYILFDVRTGGGTACLRFYSLSGSLRMWQRSSPGSWIEIGPPAPLLGLHGAEFELDVDGNRAAALVPSALPNAGRVEVYDRQPSGAWTLVAARDFLPAPGADPVVLGSIQLDGQQVILRVGTARFEVLEVDPSGTLPTLATLRHPSPVATNLRDDVILALAGGGIQALPRSDVTGPTPLCETRGRPLCTDQAAGELRYELPLALLPGPDELVLVNAPPGRFTSLAGSNQLTPMAGSPSALCVGPAGTALRFPEVRTVAADGTARWVVDPSALPAAAGGTVSGLGETFVFQALVRVPGGFETSDAWFVGF